MLAAVTAPWPRAVALRRRTASLVAGVATSAHDRGTDPATTTWVVNHRDPLRIAGVVVALLVLWWGASSWLWVAIVLAILAAYEVALSRLSEDEVTAELIADELSDRDDTSVL